MCFFKQKNDDDIRTQLKELESNATIKHRQGIMRSASIELLIDLAITTATNKSKDNIAAEAEIVRRSEVRSCRNYKAALLTLVVSIIAVVI